MSQVKANSFTDASGGSNAVLYGVAAPTNSMGFRNRIINGDMRIDQRNAGASVTVTTSGAYTVDRWYVQPNNASVTTQRVAGSGAFQNALRITGAASVTQCYVQQKIEALNSYDLAGQTITVTIRASSSTLTSLTCYVERATAGVDNWSTFATDKTQSITINSTPTDYSFQATLSGSATNGIRFIFATGAFTSGTLDITGVQLEAGTVASPFERRDYGRELMMCQRYYQRYQATAAYTPPLLFGFLRVSTGFTGQFFMPVVMRAAPTLSSTNSTNAWYIATATDLNANTITLDASSPVSVSFNATSSAGVSGQAGKVYPVASGTYFDLSAEL